MIIRLLFTNPIEFFGWLLAFLIAVMSHEVAHGVAAGINGDHTAKYSGRMNFNPLNHFDLTGLLMFVILGFGYAKPVPVDPRNFNNYRKGCFDVSIAGVLTNFILAFIAFPLYYLAATLIPDLLLFDDLVIYFLIYLVYIDIWMLVFNLLPIYPLDGFRLVELYTKPGNRFVNFMYRYSRFILLGYIALSYLGDAIGVPFFNIVSYLGNFVFRGIAWFWGLIF